MFEYSRVELRYVVQAFLSCNMMSFLGFSALHLSVIRGSLNPVKMLVQEGNCNINQPDGRSGRTALHHAVNAENLAVSGFLLLEVNH